MATRPMKSRFAGKCASCGSSIKAGENIQYDYDTRKAYHSNCDVVEVTVERPAGNYNQEQARIVEFALNELQPHGRNLQVEAFAGTGKTWLLQQIVWELNVAESHKCRYVTFSKELAAEAQQKFPPCWASASTFHAMGVRLLKEEFPRSKLNTDKVADIVARRPFVVLEGSKPVDYSREVIEALNWARECLVGVEEAASWKGFDWPQNFYPLAEECLADCASETHHHDFTDMVWLPVKLGLRMKVDFKTLMADEVQDLNPMMLEFLLKCIGKRKGLSFIFVGDRNQSIYEWRGARASNMDDLQETFDCELLTQPETFRCPVNHVELVRQIGLVPEYRGNVPANYLWQAEQKDAEKWINSSHTVIARTNATLASMAMKLLKGGKRAVVKNKDFGTGLLALIKKTKVGDNSPTRDCMDKITRIIEKDIEVLQKKLSSPKKKALLEQLIETKRDTLDCLDAIAQGVGYDEPTHEFKSKVSAIFSDTNEGVQLYTIHGSKGKTFNHTVILDFDTFWEVSHHSQGEPGRLLYVALTRSCGQLTMLYKGAPVELPIAETKPAEAV